MNESIVTSKGTVTIAAPLRKALNIKPGQKVRMSLNSRDEIVIRKTMTMEEFKKRRAKITAKIPDHLKGKSLDEIKNVTSEAWAENAK